MSNEITISGLTDINSINPNGVYEKAEQVNGKDSWERTIENTTFVVQYYVLVGARNRLIQKWQLVNKADAQECFATGNNAATPWESTWQDGGQPYGIPVVTEGLIAEAVVESAPIVAEVQAAAAVVESVPVVTPEVAGTPPSNSRFDMYADGNESGEERFYRLFHLGYV